MLYQEHHIAQAEHALYEAQLKRFKPEGVTVQVPNIIDRALAALRHGLHRLRTAHLHPVDGRWRNQVPAK
ncbi:MAG: hypothetical protein M1546_19140 [Chloroflexi bacterium]|nr:hypothetical protein [Chloroflexota bacterium]